MPWEIGKYLMALAVLIIAASLIFFLTGPLRQMKADARSMEVTS